MQFVTDKAKIQAEFEKLFDKMDELGIPPFVATLPPIILFNDTRIRLPSGQYVPVVDAIRTIKPDFDQKPKIVLTPSQQTVIDKLGLPVVEVKQNLKMLDPTLPPEEYAKQWCKIIESRPVPFWLANKEIFQFAKQIQPAQLNFNSEPGTAPSFNKPPVSSGFGPLKINNPFQEPTSQKPFHIPNKTPKPK
jgi:hypothetical protein